jgi:hypothetical protein
MAKTMQWVAGGCACLFFLIYIITTIIAINCGVKKNTPCMWQSGSVALVFGCLVSSAAALLIWGTKSNG